MKTALKTALFILPGTVWLNRTETNIASPINNVAGADCCYYLTREGYCCPCVQGGHWLHIEVMYGFVALVTCNTFTWCTGWTHGPGVTGSQCSLQLARGAELLDAVSLSRTKVRKMSRFECFINPHESLYLITETSASKSQKSGG